ncbi:MAG TPA: DUF5118 domain-containing protein, partial [Hymenobacter sp.]
MPQRYALLIGFFLFSLHLASAQTLADKTKGMQKMPGYFPFYWDEKGGRILLEIDKLDQEILYVNSLPRGVGSNDLGLDRGQLGDTR